PQTLKVWEFDSEKEAWMQVPGIQVDTTQHLVFAKLTHADWFGVSVDIPTIGGVTFVTNSGGGLVSVSPITPEPAGVVLLVLGASATLLRRRRRVDFGHR